MLHQERQNVSAGLRESMSLSQTFQQRFINFLDECVQKAGLYEVDGLRLFWPGGCQVLGTLTSNSGDGRPSVEDRNNQIMINNAIIITLAVKIWNC